MGKVNVGRTDDSSESQVIVSELEPTPTIIYVDRPVETIKEVIVEVTKEVIKEVPGPERVLVEYKTVEVPVMYETIKEVPVEIIKEVIIEREVKVVDISKTLEVKRELRKMKSYKNALVLSIIINVMLLFLAVK